MSVGAGLKDRLIVTTQVARFTVGRLALLIFLEIIDLPARALASTCFFSYTLNIANNPFFAYISGLAWQAGKTTNGSTCSSGLLVDIFEFPGRYVLFRGY